MLIPESLGDPKVFLKGSRKHGKQYTFFHTYYVQFFLGEGGRGGRGLPLNANSANVVWFLHF